MSISPHVLVVDDNRDGADGQALLLQCWGYEVRVAYDGPTALELARTYHPAIVLCDLNMPGMEGYEVAQRLREGLQRVLLIAVTACSAAADFERAFAAGFDHYLVKPVDCDQVKRLLAAWEL